MQRIFFILVCLACASHGRRVASLIEQLRRSSSAANNQAGDTAPISYSLAELDDLSDENDVEDGAAESSEGDDETGDADSEGELEQGESEHVESEHSESERGESDHGDAEHGDSQQGEEQPQEQKISRMLVIEYFQGPEQKPPLGFPPGGGEKPASGNTGSGDDEDEQRECQCQPCCLARRLRAAEMPEEASEVAMRELERMKNMPPTHPEHSTIVEYLEWMADLPWNKSSQDRLTISAARAQLEADHFGMEKVKSRIIEYLSVVKLKGDLRSPILCLHGPPGIGKTSLGRSVADALNRDFYRVSLGGVHSEAEIRGHRRTYVGAMPGLIIQALKKCATNNCVIMLDEIDKLGQHSLNGDPSAALLEVLDPEQNGNFRDHFLNLPFDLSRVLFIATANELETIPRALRDRMEVIEMSGYTVEEKVRIGLDHLLPKQRKNHGLGESDVDMDESTIDALISGYTREAGVRELDRQLAAICRSIAAKTAEAAEAAEAEASDRNETEGEGGCAMGGCSSGSDGASEDGVAEEDAVVDGSVAVGDAGGEAAQGAADTVNSSPDLPFAAHITSPFHSADQFADEVKPKSVPLRFGSFRASGNANLHENHHVGPGSFQARIGVSPKWHKQ